ncbi:MAG TPA: glycosyltransferase family A protein [Candidatus Micrarchaeaceae archaeon]|nr:glycosyltransferase family A protein [Candidatus Micrarchaeaceae archaeon]
MSRVAAPRLVSGGGARRVSVVVPTRDRDSLLKEALASVRANEEPSLDLEILVIDNGSGESTRSIADELGARYLRCATPGVSAARNRGVAAASGEYVAFLDDDDVWMPRHLCQLVEWLAGRPEFGAVLGQVQNTDFELRRPGLPWPVSLPNDGRIFAQLLRVQPQLGATVIRKSVLDQVGQFDETLLGDEDWDLHMRLAIDHLVGFVPVPSVLFRRRPSGSWDDLHWRQFGPFRRVFWRNVRRAGKEAPPLRYVLRTYLHHLGAYHSELLNNAKAHARAGRGRAARLALVRSVVASPLHATVSMARDPEARLVAAASIRPRLGRGRGGRGSEPVR